MELNEYMKELGITKYQYNKETGLVDVDGDVSLKKSYSTKKARKILVKFGEVTGDFDCSFSLLTSLEGSPQSVANFNCSHNNLKNLFGSPKVVKGDYLCHSNKNLSLDGVPSEVGGNFDASNCGLNNILAAPKFIGGNATFSDNFISTTKGLEVIKGDLNISNNKLVAIGEIEIGGNTDFSCNPIQPDDDMERARW